MRSTPPESIVDSNYCRGNFKEHLTWREIVKIVRFVYLIGKYNHERTALKSISNIQQTSEGNQMYAAAVYNENTATLS